MGADDQRVLGFGGAGNHRNHVEGVSAFGGYGLACALQAEPGESGFEECDARLVLVGLSVVSAQLSQREHVSLKPLLQLDGVFGGKLSFVWRARHGGAPVEEKPKAQADDEQGRYEQNEDLLNLDHGNRRHLEDFNSRVRRV